MTTDSGEIPTPVFMPVGTQATVKAVTNTELIQQIQASIILGNTYHLFLRPGNEIISRAGGLHRFMNWYQPILTDSGGYQVFSLAENRTLEEEGVIFKSHLDGSSHRFTPENVVETQRILGSDIMMALDECPPYPATRDYVIKSMDLTHRWAGRSRQAFHDTRPRYGKNQLQFGIIQGGTHADLRKESSKAIMDCGFEGHAIGGLSVGEPIHLMYEMTDVCTDVLPQESPRYLMGVGTPANLLHSIARGVDMFDCVMPTRNARNGMVFTRHGTITIRNAKWKSCFESLDSGFESDLCRDHSLAYLHHLFKTGEILGIRLVSVHNLMFFIWLMNRVREKIAEGNFSEWYENMAEQLSRKL